MDISTKLNELAKLRESDEIIAYLTSDKLPPELFSTQVAQDIVPIFDKHLFKLGKKKKISLFLYTTGGFLDAPWALVSLIREYCEEFEVIVPYKALSAGTLICLGADKIVMTPLGFLSPIDPQGSFPNGQERKNVQIEDVTGFVSFAKGKIGLTEQSGLSEVMKVLSTEIPPSVLGSVNRTHSLIRLIADGMLKMHKTKVEDSQAKTIIENLTEKLFSHQYFIGRREAKDIIGFKDLIDYPQEKEEKLIRDIFRFYRNAMLLDEPFEAGKLLGDNQSLTYKVKRAVIQSSVGEDSFMTDYLIQKDQNPTSPRPFSIRKENQGWNEVKIEQNKKKMKKLK